MLLRALRGLNEQLAQTFSEQDGGDIECARYDREAMSNVTLSLFDEIFEHVREALGAKEM